MTVYSLPLESRSYHVSDSLTAGLKFLENVVRTRLAAHFGSAQSTTTVDDLQLPVLEGEDEYSCFVARHELSFAEHVALLLALAAHVHPDLMDRLIAEALPQGGDFPQIGGVRGQQSRSFLPTGETVLFLLAAGDLERRFALQQIFDEDQALSRTGALRLEAPPAGEPAMCGKLVLDPEFVELVTTGRVTPPSFAIDFPARRITTPMDWDDLVLPAATLDQVREIRAWITYGETLLSDWGMGKKLKPGYRVLFHGPPGTGKTLTATLLGKVTGRDVYRVDLSSVVSKFIGETEKNLANLFNKAENKDWILFFDEADALFGKRTNVRDAHDRYANQEIAYLLQRVEDFAGLVILGTNFKNNIDDAFARRFQAAVHFPIPGAAERLRLWQLALPAVVELSNDVQLDALSRQFELTGAHILNVVQYACLRALERGDRMIRANDLSTGIRREISKEGKVL